jgi:hypothetical protein
VSFGTVGATATPADPGVASGAGSKRGLVSQPATTTAPSAFGTSVTAPAPAERLTLERVADKLAAVARTTKYTELDPDVQRYFNQLEYVATSVPMLASVRVCRSACLSFSLTVCLRGLVWFRVDTHVRSLTWDTVGDDLRAHVCVCVCARVCVCVCVVCAALQP